MGSPSTNPFTSPTIANYRDDEPADDGSQVAANVIQWGVHVVGQIATPLKTYIDDLITNVTSAFGSTFSLAADVRNDIEGQFALVASELTIASGAVTPTRSHHTVDTEADAATDNLTTLTGTSSDTGALVILQANNTARTVVCVNAGGGAGQLHNADGADFSLDDTSKMIAYKYDGTDWYEAFRSHPFGVVQLVNTTDGTLATGTTVIPLDDTTPQNTEGDEYMTLAITPKNASNLLKIEVVVLVSYSVAATIVAALFQDSTVGALAAVGHHDDSAANPIVIKFNHYMTAGTTSATTFKVRIGGNTAGTTTFNGAGAAQLFNTLAASSITITEFAVQ